MRQTRSTVCLLARGNAEGPVPLLLKTLHLRRQGFSFTQ